MAATTAPEPADPALAAETTEPVGSARALLLTVLGDLVLPTGGRAWLGALTAAMQELSVSPAATRQALRRLVGQGLVEPERHGRLAAYALTPAGRRRLEEAAERIYLRRTLAWDGRWRLLSYSFDSNERAARDALRRELSWLGYGALSNGLWICPWDLGTRRDAVLAKHGVAGSVQTFTSHLDGDDRQLAARAYDLTELRAAHRAFLDDVEPELAALGAGDGSEGARPAEAKRPADGGLDPHSSPLAEGGARPAEAKRPADGGLDPNEAFRRRLELVHRWRRFLFLDPGLPRELVPADWLGERAGTAFLALYRALEPGGWERWSELVANADPDGHAPTVPGSNLDPVRPTVRSNGATGVTPVASGSSADARREEEFLARIQAGDKVEAGDWMPDTYRQLNVKFIEMHANSEIMGALPEREWIARAPTLRRKRSLAAKVQDEVGHAHLIYRVAESLGRPRAAMYEDLINGRGKFHNVFHYPTYTWGDVACIGFLVDGAAIVTQRALLETSYAPYVRVMRRVVAEESLHYRHGEDIMLALGSGTDEQFEMLQEAVNRWWEPVMHFFGTDVAAEDDPMIHWGVKSRTNEQSRQEWIGQYVPKLWDMGIDTPDPALAYDPETATWSYTEPDWDRLKAIIKGEPTPATATRLYWRKLLHDHHAWVREVITGDTVPAVAA